MLVFVGPFTEQKIHTCKERGDVFHLNTFAALKRLTAKIPFRRRLLLDSNACIGHKRFIAKVTLKLDKRAQQL